MGEAQGKKVSNRHCGQAIEAQPSFGQIKPSETVLLVGPAALQGEDLADIAPPPQEAGRIGRRKRNPRVQTGGSTHP